MRASRLLAFLAALWLILAGCGEGAPAGTAEDTEDTGATGVAVAARLSGTLTVSAATSLRDAFARLGEDFTAEHPQVEVTFNFDSSSTLATQILEGAPADVYASADEANMAKLTDENLVAESAQFARNELVIVTKPGNPEGIAELADLAEAGVISLCGEEVPCGRYAHEVLGNAGVEIPESSVTRGQNVGATLTAVTEGDAIAGIVYVTDAHSAGDSVETVPIAEDVNVVGTYPIAVLRDSANAEAAEAFVAHVLGERGQAVLSEHGFLPVG